MSGTTSGVLFEMSGREANMIIFRGKSLSFEVIWGGATPIDITGHTANLQARSADGTLMMELSTANGRVANGGANGKLTFSAALCHPCRRFTGVLRARINHAGRACQQSIVGPSDIRGRGRAMTDVHINQTTVSASVVSAAGVEVTPVSSPVLVSLASGGGVTDHGELTGLSDDDHPQYHTDARGDARYPRLGQIIEWPGDTLTGIVPWRYKPASTDPTAPKFNFSVQGGQWTNGPPSEPSYWDHVAHMGWNWVGGTREDASKAGYGLSFESKFWDGSRFGGEFHLQGEDTSGNPHRWFGAFLPHDGSGAGLSFDVGYLILRNNSSAQRVTFDFVSTVPTAYLDGGVNFKSNTNNAPVLWQKNAAGTDHMALPFVDNFNRAACGAPFFINALAPDGEYGSGLAINIAGMTANKSCLYMQYTPAVTGDVYAVNAYNMAASGKAFLALGNNTVNGHAVSELRTEVGNGDPLVSFSVNGGAAWSVGVDNSDGDKFKISAGWQRLGVGAEDRLVIDGDIVAEWKLPMKLRSYTVAGLPSASAAGAGAMVYVSNASGGPTLACSDGTNWRVVAALGAVVG